MVVLRRPVVPNGTAVARLADTASGAPFFATSFVIHGTGRVRRDYLEIMAVTGGQARLVTYPRLGEPRTHRLQAGTMILFRPIDDAKFVVTDAAGLSTRYVSFSDSDWETFAGLVGLDPSWITAPQPPMVFFDAADADVLRPFDHAIQRFREAPTSLDLVQFLSGVIPVLFPAYGRRHAGVGAPDWLLESLDAMREEENLRLGVPRWRELAHVSASHLSVSVRRYFETTPTAVVSDLRLRHAARLLSTTVDSVRSIAVRCGFDNLTYFSTCFRRAHHLPPRAYRSRARGGAFGET
jgi:AraC-like DNA-binding protein